MNKIILIDGNSIINRAYYGLPILSNKQGEYTNGIYGFLNIITKYIEEVKPTHIAVAFDLKAPTFRHRMFDGYKGTRKKAPDELVQQFSTLKELLTAMKITHISLEGYEADDILGTLSRDFEKKGFECYILSGDRDTLQLATENTTILLPKTSKGVTTTEVYDDKAVMEKYGVTPTQFIDVKALMGDTSDNIPGVSGIGEKGATKIIAEYDTLENAIENYENVKPKRASENLNIEREKAIMSKVLATINCEVPLQYNEEDFSIKEFYNEESITILRRLEIKKYIPKDVSKQEVNATYTFVDINTALEKIAGKKELYFYQFIDESVHYFTIFIENNCIIIKDPIMPLLYANIEDILQNSKIVKVFFDFKDFLYTTDVDDIYSKAKNIIDLSVGMYVVNPILKNYQIEEIAFDTLGIELNDITELLGKGKGKKKANELEENIIGDFLIRRSSLLPEIYNEIKSKIVENKQEKLFYDIEIPLISVLYEMEKNGITLDSEALESFGKELNEKLEILTNDIYALAGEEFNINSPSQLGVILFEKLGLKGGKKTKTGYSTSADVLEKLRFNSLIVDKVLEYRGLAKLSSTYVNGLIAVIGEDKKIHSNFNQKITASGRISSTNPNIQNIPIRTELGKNIRRAFVTSSDDYCFVAADYSQIELRVLAHLSKDEMLINAFNNNNDIHAITASQVFGVELENVTPLQRSSAKAVNFGIIYGMSSFSLAQDIKVTKKEADEYIANYFATYPNIKAYLDTSIQFAKDNGYIKTIFDRVRPVPEIKSNNFIQRGFGERIAMNSPIQGAAADIIKIAMVNVNNKLKTQQLKSKLILQIHDELIIEAHKDEVEQVTTILKEEMEKATNLLVKLDVDVNTGYNWAELK